MQPWFADLTNGQQVYIFLFLIILFLFTVYMWRKDQAKTEREMKKDMLLGNLIILLIKLKIKKEGVQKVE